MLIQLMFSIIEAPIQVKHCQVPRTWEASVNALPFVANLWEATARRRVAELPDPALVMLMHTMANTCLALLAGMPVWEKSGATGMCTGCSKLVNTFPPIARSTDLARAS